MLPPSPLAPMSPASLDLGLGAQLKDQVKQQLVDQQKKLPGAAGVPALADPMFSPAAQMLLKGGLFS